MSNEHSPLIKEMVFSATLQLRTPLYVLERDGQRCAPRDLPEPDFPEWAGIWTFAPPSLDEALGVPGLDELRNQLSRRATHSGPQHKDDYLPFLIAFRQIVEGDASDQQKIEAIEAMRDKWGPWVDDHGGPEKMLAFAQSELGPNTAN